MTDQEYKDKKFQDLELHNINRYSTKLKSHSERVSSIRESVHKCKEVLAPMVDGDYKVILNSFKYDYHAYAKCLYHKLFAAMCLHHVSSLSYTEKLNISNILNNLPECIGRNTTKALNDYIDLFFRHLGPERSYYLISRIWHFDLDKENALKYSLCKKLMKSENPRNEQFLCANIKNLAYLWKTDNTNRKDSSLLLTLLHYAVHADQKEDVKFIKLIIATHMDCRELFEAFSSYIQECNTEKLLSLSKLIDTLDVILKSDPQQKLRLLCLHLGELLVMKHFEEFKETVIHYRQIFLSDTCNLEFVFSTIDSPKAEHAHFTVLLYLLYFCITTKQYESEAHALTKKVFAITIKGGTECLIEYFFSLLTQLGDGNTQHTLIFTEILLQIWEEKNYLKLAVIYAYGAYLRKSKCFELHRKFLRYHFQCLLSTALLRRTEHGKSAECENVLMILHHITNCNEITSLNITMNRTKFISSFRQYVSLCDETQILCVPGAIEKVGIIWESDQIFMVHAILIVGSELIKRGCFKRYKWLVIRHQSLLISELTKNYNLREITDIYSNQIFFLTLLNLLQHYTIFDQCTKMKRLRSAVVFYFQFGMQFIFSDYISTCDKKQILSTSLSLQYLWQGIRDPHDKLQCLLIFWKRISGSGCTDQFKDFIVDHKHFILSMKDAALDYCFNYKTEYCVLLFHLLREFIMSNNNKDMNLTLSVINDLKHNMLNDFEDSQNSTPNEIYEEERTFLAWKYSNLYTVDEVLKGNLELHEYVRVVIDTYHDYKSHGSNAIIFKIFTYYLHNRTTVQQGKGVVELIDCVVDVSEEKRYSSNRKSEILSVIFDVVYNFLVLKHEVDQTKLALILLQINKKCQSDLVKKVTVEAGNALNWKTLTHQSFTSDANMIIYKSFCIVRQKKKTNRLKEINLDEYTGFFEFIDMIDQEEQRQKITRQTLLLLIFLLLVISITSDGHHKSAKLKKYLSLKYEYDDLVLYLLWCSGDVEINPGPTFCKIRSMPASEKERKWICEVCSVLVKLLKELPEQSKPKALWKEKPTCWPTDEPFFDPNNKSKVQNDDLLSNERLLKCLMSCCDEKKICLPEIYRNEINLLVNNNKSLLFETYIFRKEKHNICEALSNLLMCKDRGEQINQDIKNCGITLNFDLTQPSQNSKTTKRKGEIGTYIKRDLAVLLCKIVKGRPIHEKCDGLWKTPPSKWSTNEPFYSPHNGKKRQGKCPDEELVDNLIKYCKSNSVVIPSKYQGMVTAWNEKKSNELIEIHTIYANIAKLEHSLKHLQIEGILAKPDILDILKKEGLTLDTDTWKLDDTKTDGNQITSRKRYQKLVNPITSEDTAIKKSSSCDGRDTQFQKLNISKTTTEDSQNTLLSSTDKTPVGGDSLSPESTSLRKIPPKLSVSEEVNSQKRRLNTETFDREEHEETKKQKMNNCLSEISVPLTQEEEDKLKAQLDEPAPPLSEASKNCYPPDFDNILSSLLNCNDLENSITVDKN
ncbi:unnamed protein product [Mytilus coruscus]|uniref:Uncharacterized protein n=1 Tax=Mytilus coruscus TaxID=42192 RepID=A0A6J7ZZ72_MYTCO|nr:unnamed protein product [Mytilus coruscus]